MLWALVSPIDRAHYHARLVEMRNIITPDASSSGCRSIFGDHAQIAKFTIGDAHDGAV